MRCGVPRTKVYATLKKLVERGLVFELPAEPRKFAPTSPADAFEPYLLHSREKTSDRVISLVEADKLVSLLEDAYEKAQSTIEPQKEEVWIVRGRAEILSKVGELLSGAKESVTVVTTEDGFVSFYKAFGKSLDKLVDDGVNVQIGAPINSQNGSLARELNYICKVNHVKVRSPLLYLSVDDQAFFLGDLRSEKDRGVVCYNSTLCDIFSLLLPRLAK